MQRIAIVATLFAVLALPARGFADLGCVRSGSESVATCSVAADCAAVGGSECTEDFCACESGPISPFCSCAAQPAPAVSPAMLVLLVGMLAAIAVVRMRQQAAARNER